MKVPPAVHQLKQHIICELEKHIIMWLNVLWWCSINWTMWPYVGGLPNSSISLIQGPVKGITPKLQYNTCKQHSMESHHEGMRLFFNNYHVINHKGNWQGQFPVWFIMLLKRVVSLFKKNTKPTGKEILWRQKYVSNIYELPWMKIRVWGAITGRVVGAVRFSLRGLSFRNGFFIRGMLYKADCCFILGSCCLEQMQRWCMD